MRKKLLLFMTWLLLLPRLVFSAPTDYASRAPNYDGKIFHNEHEFILLKDIPKDVPVWALSDKEVIPESRLPLKTPDFTGDTAGGELFFTWFGHSSLLLQMDGKNILFDPVFSRRSSPVQFAGPKRFTPPPCSISDLPEIDILIISHDHYDHLDKNAIKKMDSKVKKYVCPLGVEKRLKKFGVTEDKITNMAWWEEIRLEDIDIACTPARHFSGRSLSDRFETLWASWVLSDGKYRIFESGIKIITPYIGETVPFSKIQDHQNRWYESIR